MTFLALVAGLCSPAAETLAATPPSPPPSTSPLRISAQDTPTIDGLLDEPVWALAPVVGNFMQRDPREGEPATEQTEVRILYSDRALIFGVRCHDSQPESIRARELRRDDTLENDDIFSILLDTYHDHRNAYVFATNALGTRFDALITEENRNMNVQWDEKWMSAGNLDERGWTVEIEIPFKSLRSKRARVQTWGLNFERMIRRKNEETYWAGYTRDYEFWHVSQAGHLTQLEDVQAGLKLRVKPYLLGGLEHLPDDDLAGTHFENESQVGIEDIKVSITPSVTADFTVNPDFAQAEVDESRVNLTRFSLFFPEKREFFLEGAGVFDFGTARTQRGSRPPEIIAFYSRRIGLADDNEIPILGGAKVTGELDGFQFGLLNMQTRDRDGMAASNFGVFRFKRRLLERSYIGGIFTNTTVTEEGGFNRIAGVDTNFVLFDKLTLFGFFADSSSEGLQNDDSQAYQTQVRWMSDKLEVNLERQSVGADFDPAIGFVRRDDMIKHRLRLGWRPRPRNVSWIRQYFLSTTHTWFKSRRDFLETRINEVFGGVTLERGDFIGFGARRTYEFLEEPFEIHPDVTIPVGSYEFTQGRMFLRAARQGRLSGEFRGSAGQFFGGDILNAELGPVIKLTPHMSVDAMHSFNRVNLPQGSFNAQATNTRFNYNFNNRLLTSTTLQYNNVEDEFTLNFRINYIYRPGDDLFIVFNEGRDYTDPHSNFTGRTLLVKFTHSFDF